MDRNEAASVIRRYLTCTDITDITHSCNGKCEKCRYHTSDEEKELALKLAIEALGKDTNVPSKEIIHCKDCLYRKICSWKNQGATFCSFGERGNAE
jgi:hypothetical protein